MEKIDQKTEVAFWNFIQRVQPWGKMFRLEADGRRGWRSEEDTTNYLSTFARNSIVVLQYDHKGNVIDLRGAERLNHPESFGFLQTVPEDLPSKFTPFAITNIPQSKPLWWQTRAVEAAEQRARIAALRANIRQITGQ